MLREEERAVTALRPPGTEYRILVPVANPRTAGDLIRIASAVTQRYNGHVVALGVVEIPEGQSLSEGATTARTHRRLLQRVMDYGQAENMEIRTMVRISRQVWQGILEAVAEEHSDLVLFGWKGSTGTPDRIFGTTIDEVVKDPPCDIAVVKQRGLEDCRSILLPVRGGPHARLALKIALALADRLDASVTALNVVPAHITGARRAQLEASFDQVFAEGDRKRIRRVVAVADAVEEAILAEAVNHQLVIMGASAPERSYPFLFGRIPEGVAQKADATVIVVKTREPIDLLAFDLETDERDGQYSRWGKDRPLSMVVEKWFAENTFHSKESARIDRLVELKRKQGLTISLGLPALNEEQTIGPVISTMKAALYDRHPLLDEIVLIDSGSTDATVSIAQDLGIPTHTHMEILPEVGAHVGKGEALWKSLHVLNGDLIVWVDTDIRNIHPKFVYGLLGPLLREPQLQFVKGFYRRPLLLEGGMKFEIGGGRVTELTVRPLLNLFFPELCGMVQPLSGEYAGRRAAFEQIPFFTGYGVETGMLIDLLDRFGLAALGQTDLRERIHRNQTLASLSRMAFAIIQVVLHRLQSRGKLELLTEMSNSMKLINCELDRYYLDVREIQDEERPPIITVPGYRLKRGLPALD